MFFNGQLVQDGILEHSFKDNNPPITTKIDD